MSIRDVVPYLIANEYFYDVPERVSDDDSKFAASERPVPLGWIREPNGLTVALRPNGLRLPDQGWKIHVSTTPLEADQVIDLVWEYCVRRRIAFKFLRSRAAVVISNSKYWPRSASGKVITLYPFDDVQFAAALRALAPKLRKFVGPYILGDLRYGNGPLFVRYGAFQRLWYVNEDGTRLLAIRTPDQRFVPDRRDPVFTMPDFVTPPKIIEPYIQNPPGELENFPYEFEHPLHFSNAGGVYLGRSSISNERVVLREARPHAGLDGKGGDAVTRLLNEREILSRLQGLDCVPRLIDFLKGWEHTFLVTEHLDGNTLLDEIIGRYPLVHPDPTEADLTNYVEWATDIFRRLEVAVDDIHARGINVGDLHPNNVIVRSDGRVAIIDFEYGSLLSDKSPQILGAPGFIPPIGLPADRADHYALNCVRLMVLLPIVTLLSLAPMKAQTLVTAACTSLPVDPMLRSELERGLSVGRPAKATGDAAAEMFATSELEWPSIRGSLASGILAAASPERSDRLFPGDPLQFSFGGATLGYGAAGVLLALTRVGETVPAELVDWLSRAGSQGNLCSGQGVYDGLHGIAYALESLDARDAALDVLAKAAPGATVPTVGLFSGRSGIALNYLHFAQLTGDVKMHSAAMRLGDEIARKILEQGAPLPGTRPGLFHGATGPALLCLCLYEDTGDSRYLDAAEKALRSDLSFGGMQADGTFHIRAGARYLIYVDGGSAGIAMVLARYLSCREVPDLAALLEAIYQGCRIPFVLQPGLFQGRAGMIAALSESSSSAEVRAAVTGQIRRLGWHAILHGGNLAFPGAGLVRLSCDLATGSAGILLALRSAFEKRPLGLPFL